MFRIAMGMALAALMAGCSAGGPGGPAEALTAASVSSATWLTITDDGAGPVTGTTSYNEAALASVSPNADIRSIQTANERKVAWTHAAFIDGTQAVQFFKGRGNKVAEIHGVSQHLTGPNGERIGMTMNQARVGRRQCRAGKALWRGMAVCKARGTKHVKLVFSIPGYEGPFNKLPSSDDLKRAELQRIVWTSA